MAAGGHDAVLHQALDHLGPGLLHPAGQFAHRDLCGDLHGEGGLLGDFQLETAHLLRLLLTPLVRKGHLSPLLASGAAEFLLTLLPVPASAACAGALGHILQLLVVLIQVDIGGLAGIHHLGLGHHPGRAGLTGLLILRLSLLALPLGRLGRALRGILCGSAVLPGLAALGPASPVLRLLAALVPALGGGGLGRSGLGLLSQSGVGIDGFDTADLVGLGQVLEDHRQLLVRQVLAGLLRRVEVLAEDLDDLLCLHPEILRQLVYLILIYDITQ